MTTNDWESVTAEELRIAAKVARASGGVVMAGAASAWELRADLMHADVLQEELALWDR